MPGLAHRNDQTFGFWSNHGDDISFNQLQKFWGELSLQSRQQLLRIEKQTLFEQARKNMYCSRCNGLLLEAFLQIVMYGKSLQQEGATGNLPWKRSGVPKNPNDGGSTIKNGSQDEIQNPSIHPWGGLTTTRDGYLTILDCYLHSKSLKGLQNVFDCARARERDRELLYPDACGGGGRGWISLGVASYGRGHGTRETCALHTARLSCNTLVDFWSALGEETRQSLLKMKEEDFIERLLYRFDSKRFCRDCRRNVIREFKELKELKRIHKEPRCTNCFCAADTAFQYEVSNDTVQADWHQTFADNAGTYHHFEWAIGSAEGKFDILEFENVGTSGCVQVSGLDLGHLSACHITLRAWRLDGRCTELSVKAHALRGQPCVHCRLIVGDGYITITRGESIKRFFEHAEEAEEEEDDDSMDRDGSDLDGECFRPQKHAKSPELAREFLLDAATVIFKEQVEKAFREGTARQNAHSIFVCLALKLLEERVHVACKEIITIEKQMKLLEEEEKEKREEEERKERKRTKEREKKLRRKERLKEKERQKDKKCQELVHISVLPDASEEELTTCADRELVSPGSTTLSRPASPEIKGEQPSSECTTPSLQHDSSDSADAEVSKAVSENGSFDSEQSNFSRRRLNFWKDEQFDQSFKPYARRRSVALDNGSVNRYESRYKIESFQTSYRSINGSNRRSMITGAKANGRGCGVKHNEKVQSPYNRNDRYNFGSCCCNQQSEYRAKGEAHVSVTTTRQARDSNSMSKSESTGNTYKQAYQNNKYMRSDCVREGSERMKNRVVMGILCYQDTVCPKKVWEPAESQKKYPRSSSDSDITSRSSAFESEKFLQHNSCVKSYTDKCLGETGVNLGGTDQDGIKDDKSTSSYPAVNEGCQNKLHVESENRCSSQEAVYEEVALCSTRNLAVDGTQHSMMSISSNSDNCSSCISEGDNNTSCSNHGNFESSSTSDSEDAIRNFDVKGGMASGQNGFSKCEENGTNGKQDTDIGECIKKSGCAGNQLDGISKTSGNPLTRVANSPDNGRSPLNLCSRQGVFPHIPNQHVQFPIYQVPSTMGYYAQNLLSWSRPDALMSLPPNHYLYGGPMDYGMKGNSQLCMQYGPMQHVGTPFFNAGTFAVIEPVVMSNAFHYDEKTQVSMTDATKGAHTETTAKRTVPAESHPRESAAGVEERRENDYSSKQQAGETSFSLFHFGGPVALSTGCKSKHLSREDGIAGEFSSQFSANHIDDTDTCNKKESTIEEYNLFAASNGIRFSFF